LPHVGVFRCKKYSLCSSFKSVVVVVPLPPLLEDDGREKRRSETRKCAHARRIAFFDSPRVKDEHPDARALFYEEI